MIRKILIADRGVSALRILRTCRRLGIKSVAVYSDADKESPHAQLADEAVALRPAETPLPPRLVEAAKRTGADTIHPGCGPLAGDADFAAACEESGLTFIGAPSKILRTGFNSPERAKRQGLSVASDRRVPDARVIEFQTFCDQQGNAVQLDQDVSIQADGRTFVYESPAPSLDSDLRDRMRTAALKLTSEVGFGNAATVRFLLMPDGDFLYLESEPFLSAHCLVSEAVQVQIEIAEGRRLPIERFGACGHAIGASLYAGAVGAKSVTGTFHVWEPPPATSDVQIEAGVAEGMQVPPNDPLLAQLIAEDAAREGAIRILSQALGALWTGGVPTNQETLLYVLGSQEFLDGKARLGFLDQRPLGIVVNDASDIIFAAACSLYLEGSRHAQRTFLPGVPPNYRNNPYRDPSLTLRIGMRDLAMSWQRVDQNQYRIHLGHTELRGEVLALRPGTLSIVLDGILREFRFREVGEAVYVHSSLGSRAIQRLSRYLRTETTPSAAPQTVAEPSKPVASAPRAPTARWPTKPRRPASG
jgi:acetyl/propionyl-CoA carboxylase alpha subunit